jgi:hypothetical protein
MAKEQPAENEISIEERVRRLELLFDGYCPFCYQPTVCWEKPNHLSTKQTLLSMGIDPETGHKKNCGMK